MSTAPLAARDLENASARTSLSSRLLHDLRSHLNQIIGYADMLTEEGEGRPRAELGADLQKMGSAGRRMLTLIEENFASRDENGSAGVPPAEQAASSPPARSEDAPCSAGEDAGAPIHAPGLVLVVDDDEVNRDVLCRRLKMQGHDVRIAATGSDALQMLRESAFDLVLLDIMMPDMDGYEVLGHIKEDEGLRHIPVIMISALNELRSVVRCIEAGAEDYLAKPFNPTLLKARIGACLEKKRGRDRETVLYAQLQDNYKRLQEVEKLRDDMRNMIVHDLRTPLTAVIIGMEMLEKFGALNETQQELIAIAGGGGKTLLGMINDLLDVEKMEAGSTQLRYVELSAAALIAGAVEQVAALAGNGQIALATEIASDLPLFSGDENKLSRTLVNLIANAIKFAPAGTVTVTACQADGDTILFAVRDTGAGIPAEAFERIFEKFGQLDSRSQVGTGLGLAFCKLAVEAHGGRIQVESTVGVGSTFSFTIPRAAALVGREM